MHESVLTVAASRCLRIASLIAALCACAVPCAAIEPGTSSGSRAASTATASPLAGAHPVALPDAPQPYVPGDPIAAYTQPSEPAFVPVEAAASASVSGSTHAATTAELDAACQSGALRGKPCKAHWLPILWQSFEATALQNTGNIALDAETRHDLVSRPFWATYVKCVHQFRYRQWRDDDNILVDYVEHAMQGAGVASIYEQNDPKGRGLIYQNNGNYWRSRLKAMAWVTVYEVQWKIGPASEASIGNSGLNTYFTPSVHGRSTNETGFQDFVDTPILGFWWNVGEDAIDRFILPHIWKRTHNRLILTALFPLTPCKDAANILRYKPPYYRDFPLTPLR